MLQIVGRERGVPGKNYASKYEFTPPYATTTNRNYTLAKQLLENHIVTADECHNHVTPLYSAFRDQGLSMVELLTEYGADPLFMGNEGFDDTH